MNPEIDDDVPERPTAASPTRANASSTRSALALSLSASSIRKPQVFQRRLKEKISESRALEILDRKIRIERAVEAAPLDVASSSNQDQDDELVCDSTMVRFEPQAAPPEESEMRACGVLRTVRGIHRQRARDQPSLPLERENQRS